MCIFFEIDIIKLSIKDEKDIHKALKDMFSKTIQEMLKAELDKHLS